MIIAYLLIIGGCMWISKVERNMHSWNTKLANVFNGILPSILMIAGSILLWNALGLDPNKKQMITIFQAFSMLIIAVALIWVAAHWILTPIFFLDTQRHKK